MADTQNVLDMIQEHDVKYVDFRFTDPRGKWQHLAHHVRTIDDDFLNDGVPFDGSSIAGWKAINESDMLLVPDCASAVLDPFAAQTSLILFCDVHEPLTGQPYARDPRSIAKKAEQHHHEGAPSQHELGFVYSTLVKTADNMQIYKYVVHNVAHQYGKTATFMPKPIKGDNGSGMHTHQSIWKGERPLFAGNQYADLSETALYYIGGIIRHAKAINAFTNPTTNSYKRLITGFEAPVLLAYLSRNP